MAVVVVACLRCSVLLRQDEAVSCLVQEKDRACAPRNIFLNKSKRILTLQLAFQSLVTVIAFWRHKMRLNTLLNLNLWCLNSLARVTAGATDVTPGVWNEHYKIGKAEKALVNIIKNSLQAIRLSTISLERVWFFPFLSSFFRLRLYFYFVNERVMSHRLVT